MPSQWQDREAIVSCLLAKMWQIHHNVLTPWFTKRAPPWHCPRHRKVMKLVSSSAGTKWFRGFWGLRWWIAGRATNTHKECHYCHHELWEMRTLDTNLRIVSPICCVRSICTLTPEEFDFQQKHVWCERNTFQLSYSASFFWQLWKEKNTTWISTAKPRGHRMIQTTPTKNLGGREIWSWSHFGTKKSPWQWASMGSLLSKRLGNTGTLAIPMKFSPNPNAESECHHFLSTCHIMSVIPPASHFATHQLRAKCFPSRNPGSKWRMLGLWMVECSKVVTQHKRPMARLHALFVVDPGRTKVQEIEALISPQSILWTN